MAAANARLSVKETLGMVFVHRSITPWNMYRRSDPAARKCIRSIVEDRQLADCHRNAIRILGYIGDAEDAEYLGKTIEARYRGKLTRANRELLHAIFDALGIMAGRGIAVADQIVDNLLTVNYWRAADITWGSTD